ncbi:hypothetical protein BGX29_001667 [Mortierella sp. GBA35]|nr:hypothetical protein BGX23_012037 [Mortierella sp. AD031]KAF9104560.1 hypothetical protein BGX29_001667 [Mortierella sp. GBA35]KAG0218940.1 hypothetical protein BGX33_005430 [Mortierella sp. NVP41]
MPINDVNDPASHCLGLIQPFHSTFEYGLSPRLFNNNTQHQHNISPTPPKEILDYAGALEFLFKTAILNSAAEDLCQDIELPMEPPLDSGVLSYLFRLEAIGRLEEWPLLFGEGNSFVVYLVHKMSAEFEFPEDSENERMVWEQRRKETATWLKAKLKRPKRG